MNGDGDVGHHQRKIRQNMDHIQGETGRYMSNVVSFLKFAINPKKKTLVEEQINHWVHCVGRTWTSS